MREHVIVEETGHRLDGCRSGDLRERLDGRLTTCVGGPLVLNQPTTQIDELLFVFGSAGVTRHHDQFQLRFKKERSVKGPQTIIECDRQVFDFKVASDVLQAAKIMRLHAGIFVNGIVVAKGGIKHPTLAETTDVGKAVVLIMAPFLGLSRPSCGFLIRKIHTEQHAGFVAAKERVSRNIEFILYTEARAEMFGQRVGGVFVDAAMLLIPVPRVRHEAEADHFVVGRPATARISATVNHHQSPALLDKVKYALADSWIRDVTVKPCAIIKHQRVILLQIFSAVILLII